MRFRSDSTKTLTAPWPAPPPPPRNSAPTTPKSASRRTRSSPSPIRVEQNETEGWIEQTNVEYLIRRACVYLLDQPLYASRSTLNAPLAGCGHFMPRDGPRSGAYLNARA